MHIQDGVLWNGICCDKHIIMGYEHEPFDIIGFSLNLTLNLDTISQFQ